MTSNRAIKWSEAIVICNVTPCHANEESVTSVLHQSLVQCASASKLFPLDRFIFFFLLSPAFQASDAISFYALALSERVKRGFPFTMIVFNHRVLKKTKQRFTCVLEVTFVPVNSLPCAQCPLRVSSCPRHLMRVEIHCSMLKSLC